MIPSGHHTQEIPVRLVVYILIYLASALFAASCYFLFLSYLLLFFGFFGMATGLGDVCVRVLTDPPLTRADIPELVRAVTQALAASNNDEGPSDAAGILGCCNSYICVFAAWLFHQEGA